MSRAVAGRPGSRFPFHCQSLTVATLGNEVFFRFTAHVKLAEMALLVGKLEDWKPVSRGVGIAWLCFYALFLLYALADRSGFLFLDYVNLIIHEAGHPFFSWFGYTIMILGGTLAELLVPLLCAIYFFWQRETPGFAFCSFWFFENFPYIGTYMADARALALPLVGSGDHDWEILFRQWGLLMHDQEIGGIMRSLGWLGMLATVAWLAFRVGHDAVSEKKSPAW